MALSTIVVHRPDGTPAEQVLVALAFPGGLSPEVRTDERGHARVEHHPVGRADIFVEGRKIASFRAPGHTAVVV